MKEFLINLCCFRLSIWLGIQSLPIKVKWFVWNRGIKLQWNRLWVRRDEFHRSLDTDVDAIAGMSSEECKAYFKDLCCRRKIADERDMDRGV